MKRSRNLVGLHALLSGALLAVLFLLVGCETEQPFTDASKLPGMPSSATNTPVAVKSGGTNAVDQFDRFHVGDIVVVRAESHGGDIKFDPYGVPIREDGTITTRVGTIKAADRPIGDVQAELERLYRKEFVGVTVTVTAGERYFDVLGEVTSPGSKPYLKRMDVISAITAAGGPSVFAGNGILLIHPNGKIEELDYKKALRQDPNHNKPVYPGDKIFVKKRII